MLNEVIQNYDEKNYSIPSRKKWKRVFGRNSDRIDLLTQIIFKWNSFGRQGFYNFYAPSPNSKHYRRGQSWEEILEVTPDELSTCFYGVKDSATDKGFATKVTSRMAKEKGFKNSEEYVQHLMRTSDKIEHTVLIVRDPNNLNWFFVNERNLSKRILTLMKELEQEDKEYLAQVQAKDRVEYSFQNYNLMNGGKTFEISEEEDFGETFEAAEPKQARVITDKQRNFFNAKTYKNARIVLDVFVLDKLEKEGYNLEDIENSFKKFEYYYLSGKGKSVKSNSWVETFTDMWVINGYNYGEIRRNGEYIANWNAKPSQMDIYEQFNRQFDSL